MYISFTRMKAFGRDGPSAGLRQGSLTSSECSVNGAENSEFIVKLFKKNFSGIRFIAIKIVYMLNFEILFNEL